MPGSTPMPRRRRPWRRAGGLTGFTGHTSLTGLAGLIGLHALLASGPAAAQDTAAPPPPPQQVQVTGAAAQARRDEVRGQQVVTGAELARHGDTRLADALRRVPGLSVTGSGADLALRLDGMSAEQTLVLVNGERMPPGQVLEALGLASVERIEIVRGANAQWSGRGLAGTVNIVTTRAPRQRQRELASTLGSHFGRPTGQAELSLGDQADALAWRLGVMARAERERYPVDARLGFADATGRVTSGYRVQTLEANRDQTVSLSPQLQWDRGAAGQWLAEATLSAARLSGAGDDWRTELTGSPPRLVDDRLAYTHDRRFARLRLNGRWPLADRTRGSATVSFSHGRRVQFSVLTGQDLSGTQVRDSTVDSVRTDQLLSARADLEHHLSAQHQLSAGVQLEGNRRQEDRVQRERIPSWEPDLVDERYDASAHSLALYLQDDWLPSKTTTVSLGARVEQLHTRSTGNVFEGIARRHRLASPTLSLLWRPAPADQWKLSFSRAYRLPEPRDLMPRRWTRPETSSLVPNFAGNPDLQPESAWTLTAAWDRRIAPAHDDQPDSTLGLSGVLKRVDDLILTELTLLDGQYTLRPSNLGRAWVASLQLRGSTALAVPWGGRVQLQASAAARASRIAALPGPDNHLPDQAPWDAQLQASHQPPGSAWQLDAGWRWQAGHTAQAPSGRRLGQRSTAVLDLSATRAFGPQDRLRLSVSGLGKADPWELIERRWSGGLDSYTARTEAAPRWRAQWLHRF